MSDLHPKSRTRRSSAILWTLALLFFIHSGAGCVSPGGKEIKCTREEIGSGSVWKVNLPELTAVLNNKCPEDAASRKGACLRSVMEERMAGARAVQCSACLHRPGFIYGFYEAGRVDAALATYPFGTGPRFGFLLVNGTPGLIDMDHESLWPEKEISRNPRFLEIKKRYPKVNTWPGYRGLKDRLVHQELPRGGQRFIAGYKLTNGSREGEPVGSMGLRFDFNEEGVFLGSRIESMGHTIHTVAGDEVTLEIEDSMGRGTWRPMRLPSPVQLALESKKSIGPGIGRDHPADVWKFRAKNPASVLLEFLYLPSGDREAFPMARKAFLVKIHESRERMQSALLGIFKQPVESYLREIDSVRAGKVVLDVVGVHGDFARVDISPRNSLVDKSAIMILSFTNGSWQVLSISEEYDSAFYEKYKIPSDLWDAVKKDDFYLPLSWDTCMEIRNAVSKALGQEMLLNHEAPFLDYMEKTRGYACRIETKGRGDEFKAPDKLVEGVRGALGKLGWEEDQAYLSDGPMGATAGFRRENSLILFKVVREPSEEVGLLSTDPISLCDLLPEELVYTITLDCAELP